MHSLTLFSRELEINDYVILKIPTVGEVLEAEEDYSLLLTVFLSSPADQVRLITRLGGDPSSITDWELFMALFPFAMKSDLSLLFASPDFSGFSPAVNLNNGLVVLRSPAGQVFDVSLYYETVSGLEKIYGVKKSGKRPANRAAADFMIMRMSAKAARGKRQELSPLNREILSLYRIPGFPYRLEEVRDLTIYQLVCIAKSMRGNI